MSIVEEKRKKRKAPLSKWRRRKKVRKHYPKLKVGVPQGGVFSPLLGNLYLDAMDKAVNALNPKYVKMMRYADDFVIMVKPGREHHLQERTDVRYWLRTKHKGWIGVKSMYEAYLDQNLKKNVKSKKTLDSPAFFFFYILSSD